MTTITFNGYPMHQAPAALLPHLEGMDGAVAIYGSVDSDGNYCTAWELQRGGETVDRVIIREPIHTGKLTWDEKYNVNRMYGKLACRPLIDSSRWTGRPADAGSLADVLRGVVLDVLDWALSFNEEPPMVDVPFKVWARFHDGGYVKGPAPRIFSDGVEIPVNHYPLTNKWADNGSDPLAHARRLINDEGAMKAAHERHYFGNLALGVAVADREGEFRIPTKTIDAIDGASDPLSQVIRATEEIQQRLHEAREKRRALEKAGPIMFTIGDTITEKHLAVLREANTELLKLRRLAAGEIE